VVPILRAIENVATNEHADPIFDLRSFLSYRGPHDILCTDAYQEIVRRIPIQK
jgi:hypothetical protein